MVVEKSSQGYTLMAEHDALDTYAEYFIPSW
jgi:hypothetical protein